MVMLGIKHDETKKTAYSQNNRIRNRHKTTSAGQDGDREDNGNIGHSGRERTPQPLSAEAGGI